MGAVEGMVMDMPLEYWTCRIRKAVTISLFFRAHASAKTSLFAWLSSLHSLPS